MKSGPHLRRDRSDGRSMRLTAVSLVEVLVVVSIIAFLLALLIPGVGFAKEQVRRVQCKNNLRQWGAAVQMYRHDWNDYLPEEGSFLSNVFSKPNNWFNALPKYLGLPRYIDMDGANEAIELPNIHVWICPSKNLTPAYKSDSGKNQFHYGMNDVLDGLGTKQNPSKDAPDFPDRDRIPWGGEKGGKDVPLSAREFAKKPFTVYLFDIAPNSPFGSPRLVATEHARAANGAPLGKFHGDYANFLYVNGGVDDFETADLVENHDLLNGRINWSHSRLYWGYPPPGR